MSTLSAPSASLSTPAGEVSHYSSHHAPGQRLNADSFVHFHFSASVFSHSSLLPPLRLPPGFEAAEEFLKTGEVPDVWKMDMSQILDSSSSDDEDDEDEKESDEDEEDEDEKKKKKHIKEEVSVTHGCRR